MFEPAQLPTWKAGTKQPVQSIENVIVNSNTTAPNLYEFDLISSNAVLFGPQTGFWVEGTFESKADAAAADDTFAPVLAADFTKVRLMPNWFQHLIQKISVFHLNSQINCNDEAPFVNNYVNTFLMTFMHSHMKKGLAAHQSHPGNATPNYAFKWTCEAGTDWEKYSKRVFIGKDVKFLFVPLDVFPFFQSANFTLDKKFQNPLMMSNLGKLIIRMQLKEKTDHIFRKEDGNNKIYRFKINNLKLVFQEARLSPQVERQMLSSKKPFYFPGVTRIGFAENIAEGVLNHRMQITNVSYPEGLFIFCLNKKVSTGQETYTELADSIFAVNKIKDVDISFNGMPLALKSPTFSDASHDLVELRNFHDLLERGPFGMHLDSAKFSLEAMADSAKSMMYPHVYISLSPLGEGSRYIPIGDNGECLGKHGTLDLIIRFDAGEGCPQNVQFYVYLWHSDVAYILDPKTRSFSNFYNRLQTR
jgi:hypothetical protein